MMVAIDILIGMLFFVAIWICLYGHFNSDDDLRYCRKWTNNVLERKDDDTK